MTHTESDLLARVRALSTSGLSDALDRLGIAGQALGIAPLDRRFRLVGRAWTLRYGPVGSDRGSVGDYIDDLGPGDVVVLDNQGRLDATVGRPAHQHRPPPRRRRHRHRRRLPRRRPQSHPRLPRLRPGQLDAHRQGSRPGRGDRVPVSIGGIRVEPGDLLLGDGDGLVAVPAARVDEVLAAAEEIERAEDAIRAAVENGTSLREARRTAGYHDLQYRATGARP